MPKAANPRARTKPGGRSASVRLAAPPKVDPPYRARLSRLRKLVRKGGASHLLVTNPLDVAYLTGFHGGDSYLLVGENRPIIISDFRYEEELDVVKGLANVRIRRGAMSAAVAGLMGELRVKTCAIQAEAMTLAERDVLAKSLGRGGAKRLLPTTGLVASMRAIKDETEISLIKHAVRIQEAALLAVLPTIRAGQSELEVAARLEAEMKSRGSSQPGFPTIVAARTNGSLPHYRPHGVTLAKGQPLLIDWGAIYQGYHSDMTRTFSLGRWSPQMREIYLIVLEAQEMAAAALGPGKSTREIDAIARGHIAKAGYADRFGHGLGHGIGFNGHEDPRLSHMTGEATLEVGHVVTVEPGIYLPGIGGVRIEDDYVVTERGATRLCTLPKDLDWATL